jgi:hypothetical protein
MKQMYRGLMPQKVMRIIPKYDVNQLFTNSDGHIFIGKIIQKTTSVSPTTEQG